MRSVSDNSDHRVNTELSLDLKIDSGFWVSNEDIGIVFFGPLIISSLLLLQHV